MIIIKLKGGLGNQLFQYAMGRNIEITKKINVKFDLSWFTHFPQRKYQLDEFKTEIKFASFLEIIKVKKFERKDGRRYLPFNFFREKNTIHIKESEGLLQSGVLNFTRDCYLDGNWQSEKYFENIKGIIHKELTLKNESDDLYKNKKQKIKNRNSVSLHIRRGDYTTKKVQQVLKLCPLNYYYQAIQTIKEKINNPAFFIFSDDINWVKKNLQTNSPTVFISDGKLKNYEELILMSKCQHNIIANSSFSWWGAWLNSNPNKIIITPTEWFNDKSKNIKNLIPKNWIKI